MKDSSTFTWHVLSNYKHHPYTVQLVLKSDQLEPIMVKNFGIVYITSLKHSVSYLILLVPKLWLNDYTEPLTVINQH